MVTLFLIAFASASFTLFFDFCTDQGNILHWYYKLLLKIGQVKTNAMNEVVSSNFLFKPLGGCLQCFNFWLGVPFFVLLADYNLILFVPLFFLFQGISFIFVSLLYKFIQ